MKLRIFSIILALSLFCSMTQAAVVQIEAGVNTLPDAISNAAAGDVIELITDGGTYLTTKMMMLNDDITIQGAATLTNKPIIKYVGTSTSAYYFKSTASPRIIIKNLEFDGDGTADSDSTTAFAKYLVCLDNGDVAGTLDLFIDNCDVHDVNSRLIRPYANCGIDSMVITNTKFSNGYDGIFLYTGSSSDPAVVTGYLEISNSTFYNFDREIIKGDTNPTTKVLVDRITAYNCGVSATRSMIFIDDMTDVEVKNSIFVKNTYSSYFVRLDDATGLFHHNVVYDMTSYSVAYATVSDTLIKDPQFADPDNGDLTIGNSILFTFADDGGAVGDPRWAPLEGQSILKVSVVGKGTLTLDPAGGIYDDSTIVTITATPDAMWKFTGWSENINVFPPTLNPIQVMITENMEVTGYFEPTIEKYSITTNVVGLGYIEIEEISDFDLEGYYDGDSLVFTPVADTTTWEFAYWVNADGDSIGNANPLEYIVHEDTSFIAKFRSTIDQVSLALTVVGSGNVDYTPKPIAGFDTYDVGTEITLIATPVIGWTFSEWTGDVSNTEDNFVITLNSDMTINANFSEIAVPNGELVVDDTWDLLDAIAFAGNNSQVELIKLVSVGPYLPEDEDISGSAYPSLKITSDIKIVGADTMASRPVIKAWGSNTSNGMFALRGDAVLELDNLILDGYTPDGSTAAKYGFRLYDTDSITCSVKANNIDYFGAVEVFFKWYDKVHADTVRFTNCTISDIGKEGISDGGVGSTDFIEIKNCTFHHIGRDALSLKIQTPKVIIDHVTIDSVGYLDSWKNSCIKVETATDVKISNIIISNVLNLAYGYSMRFYGEDASINNALFYNSAKIMNKDGSIIGDEVYTYDPLFANPSAYNFTLKDSSIAYHMVGDGSAAVGDLKWATSTNIANFHKLNLTIDGSGDVAVSPEGMAVFYKDQTVVNLTAAPDSLAEFIGWTGSITGTDLVTSVTMDADKAVTATFNEPEYLAQICVNMSVQMRAGNFDPSKDTVDVAGNFGHMGDREIVMTDEDADSIYTMQLKFKKLAENRKSTFRFRINGVAEERNGDGTKTGEDRELVVDSDTTVVYFYNDEDGIVEGIETAIAYDYKLNQNYPNPFNPTTMITFSIKEKGETKIVVYDIRGREVWNFVNQNMEPGNHRINFDATGLASGVYFYRLTSGKYNSVKKMILLR